jgi:hypothetical protein
METADDTPNIPDEPDAQNAAIARRAYEISQGEDSGTPEENWWRAAQEINDRQETEAQSG